MTVISRSRPTSPDSLQRVRPGLPLNLAAALEDLWQEFQAELASLSQESTHLVADQSGHYIHRDKPSLVADAIHDVVRRAREYRM